MKEQPDIYERIYRETYGRAPNFERSYLWRNTKLGIRCGL